VAKASPELHEAIAALQRLAEVFQLRREQLARTVGLAEAQLRILEQISTERFMPSLFARRRERSAAAVSKVLRQLLDRGLIAASISRSDGRQRDYVLTPEGERLMAELRSARRRAIDAVWADLDPAELERFATFSEQLAVRLEAFAHGEGD
jgi:DNA-binding MarR family transcriptional regulator